jgi:heme exporter protein B
MSRGGALSAACSVARRDLTLASRRKSDAAAPLLFFIVVATLFPLGLGPEPEMLRRIGPGVLWVGALLATMLSMTRLFASDYEDGTLEQMALSPEPFAALVYGKLAAHWLVTGLPVIVAAPLLGLQYGLPGDTIAVLAASLAIGTPLLSLVGAIGAALTLGVRGGGMLMALLVLPLYVPALVFGAGAVEAGAAGTGAEPHLSLLGACLALAAFFAPWAITASLRLALE